MKKLLFLLLILPLGLAAQQTTQNFNFGGVNRSYIRYVPTNYDPNVAVPVVVALHGLGDNMSNFVNIGMHPLAEINNFIVVTPQALVDQLLQSSAWNSGAGAFGIQLNQNVDDVGFILAILDSLETHFNIDTSRVYATGFSMGGFMCHRLACESNGKFAAIASVAGTIGSFLNCSPSGPVSMLHIHGTSDGTVGYATNSFGQNAEATFVTWGGINSCQTTPGPDTTYFPDIANDGFTVEHFSYPGCSPTVQTELIKVNGADHVWLGSGYDISYTPTIWQFFSQGTAVGTGEVLAQQQNLRIYPNPAQGQTTLSLDLAKSQDLRVELYDLQGRKLQAHSFRGRVGKVQQEIDLRGLTQGAYLVNLEGQGWKVQRKLLVRP